MATEPGMKLLGADVDESLSDAWDRSLAVLQAKGRKVGKRDWARIVGQWWIGLSPDEQVAFLEGQWSVVLTEDRVRELIRQEIASALGAPAAAAQDDAEAQEAVLQNKRKTRSAKRG